MNKNIGFIGIGIMGYHIASHLLKAKKHVHIIERKSKNTQKFKKRFIKSKFLNIHNSLEKLSNNCNFIISCVGNDKDLNDIYLSKQGILRGTKPNTIIVDHTTASHKISKILYKKFLSKKSFFFDEPISGGEIGAEKGTLSIMVGGKKSKFDSLLSTLSLYSKSQVYMGNSGSGQLTKMVNQICVASIIQGLAEGLNFAKKKKLNIENLITVLKSGAGQSWQLENRGITMSKNKFNFGFMNKLMLKDLNIIFNEIDQTNIKLPQTKLIKSYYKKLIKLGYEKEDTSNLIRLLI